MKKMITGSIVALVTPMHLDGCLDLSALRYLVDWHIARGTDAIVIAGTTGESPTVTVEEHCELIRIVIEQAAGRLPVIAGSGANATQEAIALTLHAKAIGADASLQVVPYYNRPTQEGLYQHFKKIAEAVDIPIILYNVPGRTVADLSHETVLRLACIPNIVGIKDATGNIARGLDLLRKIRADVSLSERFVVYSGDDLTAMVLMLNGAKGNISVTANLVPRQMHAMCQAAMDGQVAKAIALNDQLFPLHQELFVEPNPVPVKWAMVQMKLILPGLRLPLVPLSSEHHSRVRAAMQLAGVCLG